MFDCTPINSVIDFPCIIDRGQSALCLKYEDGTIVDHMRSMEYEVTLYNCNWRIRCYNKEGTSAEALEECEKSLEESHHSFHVAHDFMEGAGDDSPHPHHRSYVLNKTSYKYYKPF